MVILTNEIKESLAATKLAFFATSGQDKTPNVVPIGAFKVLDDTTLLISDQGDKAGFQIKGTITIHTDGAIWEKDVAWMKELRPNLKPKGAVVMKITDVYAVVPGTEPGKKIL